MFFSDDVKADCERISLRVRRVHDSGANRGAGANRIAKLNDSCGNLIQITQLARW